MVTSPASKRFDSMRLTRPTERLISKASCWLDLKMIGRPSLSKASGDAVLTNVTRRWLSLALIKPVQGRLCASTVSCPRVTDPISADSDSRRYSVRCGVTRRPIGRFSGTASPILVSFLVETRQSNPVHRNGVFQVDRGREVCDKVLA